MATTLTNPLPKLGVMLTLGMFVFKMDTAPYQDFQRQVNWRHVSNNRVGAVPSSQFVGRDADRITLSGVLLPEITGGTISLALLEEMGDLGQAWPLIEGTGRVYGLFVVKSLNTTRTLFFSDGAARRIEFQLSLERTDQNTMDKAAKLTRDVLKYL